MVCVPAVLYIWESTFWGDMTNQRYSDHFPAELGHRKIPKFRKVGSHVHTDVYILPGIFLRPEVCSLMVADELLRERVEE